MGITVTKMAGGKGKGRGGAKGRNVGGIRGRRVGGRHTHTEKEMKRETCEQK